MLRFIRLIPFAIAIAILALCVWATFIDTDFAPTHVSLYYLPGALMLLLYIFSLKTSIPYYQQPYMFVLPCSKPKMMMLRGFRYYFSAENLLLVAALIITAAFAPISPVARAVTLLMVMVQSVVATAFNVMLENISKEKQAMHKNLQWSTLIANSLILITILRYNKMPGQLFHDVQWWATVLGLATATAIIYTKAKRWSV